MSYFEEGTQNDQLPPFDFTHTHCSNLQLIQSKLSDWLVVLSVILLVIINVMVIFGNILVILSVFVSQKLRTSTNYFIVSLAVADLLVGIAVLPYSLTLEVLDIWIFGSTWCQGWLVVDVWMCTASILNLCAISVDRYLAVTRPVQYRLLMTSSRAKMIILAVWLASFLICFPPLVGLNGTAAPLASSSSSSSSFSNSAAGTAAAAVTASTTSLTVTLDGPFAHSANFTDGQVTSGSSKGNSTGSTSPTCQPEAATSCKLFDEKGYVIYSALGSFWLPMAFMIFFYWRIYRVALRTTRALERGYKSTKSNKSTQGQGSPDERFTLRMHRGLQPGESAPMESAQQQSTTQQQQQQQQPMQQHQQQQQQQQQLLQQQVTSAVNSSFPRWKSKPTIIETQIDDATGSTMSQVDKCELLLAASCTAKGKEHLNIQSTSSTEGCSRNRLSPSASVHSNLGLSPCSSRAGSARSSAASARASRRSNPGKLQLRRFRAETKAAKTVSFIVGGFIICWSPFFTAYLVRAFCSDSCIPPLLMSVFTWLGYLNSAVNPIIYGLFSRDFRRAFKQIVCKCSCTPTHDTGVSSLIRNIHMPTFLDEEAAK